jgi:hypothetical protein
LVISYSGGIKGYIEPCGCQSDMLGGMARLTGLLMTYRAKGLSLLPLETGSLFFEELDLPEAKKKQAQLKAELLADSFKLIGYRAMGIGPYDLAMGRYTLNKLLQRSGMIGISSNLRELSSEKLVYPSRMILLTPNGHRIGLFSITGEAISKPDHPVRWPKDYWARHQLRLDPPEEAARREIAALQKEGATLIVLLSTLGRAQTEGLLSKVEGIDIAIDGEEGEGVETPPTRQAGRSLLLVGDKEGQKIGTLALYFAPKAPKSRWEPIETPQSRLLAIRELEKQIQSYRAQAKQMREQGDDFAPIAAVYEQQAQSSLTQIAAIRAKQDAPPKLPTQGRPFLHNLLPLSGKIPDLPLTAKRMQDYEKAVQQANFEAMKQVKAIPFNQDGDFFAGAETCRACHAPAYSFWKKTPHAHAYQTLANKNKQFDMDCIGCHVVGWQQPGGLFDLRDPKNLGNVQCENCHSYAGLHARTAQKTKHLQRDVPASVCKNCHQGSHHPNFNYHDSLKKILGKGHGEARLKSLLKKP